MNRKRDPFAEKMKQWHVVMLPMSPPKYRAERTPNYPEGQAEQSPNFQTEQEAINWITTWFLEDVTK